MSASDIIIITKQVTQEYSDGTSVLPKYEPLNVSEVDTNFINLKQGIIDVEDSISTKADIDSPGFYGTPTVPTVSYGNDSNVIASTAFVHNLVDHVTDPIIADIEDPATGLQALSTLKAPLASPNFTGTPRVNTLITFDIIENNNYALSTIAYVKEKLTKLTQDIRPLTDASNVSLGTNTAPFNNLYLKGHITPYTSNSQDLGTPTKRFRDLYLSGNTLNIGDASISTGDSGTLILPQNSSIGEADNLIPTNFISTIIDSAFANTSETSSLGISLTATGDIAAADPVAMNEDGTVSTVSNTSDPVVSNTRFIGIALNSVTNGNTVAIAVSGPISGLTNLVQDTEVFLEEDGTYTDTRSSTTVKIGKATSTTELFLYTTTGLDTYILSRKKIELTDLSIGSNATPSGQGGLSYNNSTGVFTFTPADLGSYATQSYVATQISNLIDSAPSTLDTLNELAAALGDDPNFATTLSTNLGLKAPLASPALTGTPTAPTATSGTNNTQIATTAFVQNTFSASVSLSDLSVGTNNPASGSGGLTYNSSTGEFKYTPPNLSVYATLASPALTGTPTAPTAASGANTTQVATTAFVTDAILNAASTSGYVTLTNLSASTSTQASGSGQLTYDNTSGAFTYTPPYLANYTTLNSFGVATQVASGSGSLSYDNGTGTFTYTPPALSGYATLASPSFTGTPTAPTAASGTNTTQIATTAFVAAATAGFGGGNANISVGDSSPSNPGAGDLWFNSDNLTTYVYYADGDSSQWVTATPLNGDAIDADYLSVTTNTPSGDGALSYNAATGVFSFTPADVSTFTESDPIFTASAAGSITSTQVSHWDTAYGWGNHATQGYLTTFSETDPIFSASPAYNISSTNISNWNTAYGWGDHSTQGYLTSANLQGAATETYVDNAISALVDSAPLALDTLNELAAALGDDANFSTTVTNSLATKAPLASPALTGTPTAPTATSGTNTTQIATTAFVQSEIAGFSAGASITISDSAPSSPTEGDMWFNSTSLVTYVYYNDGDSSQWVTSTPLNGDAISADYLTVNTTSANGNGALSYNAATGVFNFTPADVSSFIESDPIFAASPAYNISSTNISNWNTAYGWGDHSTQGYLTSSNLQGTATETYVDTAIANLVDSAPLALDTLNELAAALGDDSNFSATVTNNLALKAPLASPTFTGTPSGPTATSGTNTTQFATTEFVQSAISGFSSGGASVTIADAAPSSPSAGDMWFNSTDLILFIYYDDGTTSQWVEATPSASGGAGGGGIALTDLGVAIVSASGNGSLTYDSTQGLFTFTPADLSSYLTSETVTSLSIANNILSYVDESNNTTNIDLSLYLDDTNLARLVSGSLDSSTGIATFTRDDATTFTVDFSSLTPVTEFEKSYRYDGELSLNEGTKRFYMHKAATLTGIYAYIDTAPTGASVNLSLKKNNTTLQTFSIANGATSASSTGLTDSISAGDYFTVDITQIGSSTPGSNLYVVFTFV